MITELLQDRTARYLSGDMAVTERESFEVLLEFHQELRALVAGMQEMAAMVAMTGVPVVTPPSGLKARLLGAVDSLPLEEPESLVATGSDGLILWVNPAFTAMCGYTLDELKGQKPGHKLHGPATDPAAVGRIRESIRARQACRETLVNYHKDGTTYRVDIRINPVLDDEGQPLWFVARERKLLADETVLSA